MIFAYYTYSGFPPLETIEKYFYDIEMSLTQDKPQEIDNITLIEIDDKSIAELGPWPWPRHLIAEMIAKLNKNGAILIGLDIPLPDQGRNQVRAEGLAEIRSIREQYLARPQENKNTPLEQWIIENLDLIENRLHGDIPLIQSMENERNVILQLSALQRDQYDSEITLDTSSISENFLQPVKISYETQEKLSKNYLILPYKDLIPHSAGIGHGTLTINNGFSGRSHPLFINYQNSAFIPSLPLRLTMAFFGQEPKLTNFEENSIQINNRAIPLSEGQILINFSNSKNFSRLSFSDALHSQQMPPVVEGRIILIGFSHLKSEQFDTPCSKEMSEIELTANIINSMINISPISRPSNMRYIELILLLLLGAYAALSLPLRGQLSRLLWSAGLIVFVFTLGTSLFLMLGIWFQPVSIALCIAVIYMGISARMLFTEANADRNQSEITRLLTLNSQNQELLDLLLNKSLNMPLNKEIKEIIYHLGLDFEKKRMIKKALMAYEFINQDGEFRDLHKRIHALQQDISSAESGDEDVDLTIFSDGGIRPGTNVGRYKILSELGKGSMGLVYKAQDPQINRLVAIKTIRFADDFDEDILQSIKDRFFREAEIAGRLSHPSIITIHDVGDDNDLTYMAMEFLEGTSLEKFIVKENLLPFRQALNLISKIAEALYFAHKQNVIHRDIKPANIMLLNDGSIKVMDFGIAKAVSSSRTKTGVILGTPNYMSPEQIMGQKVSFKSDIFSLGVLFFQIITGELPFQGSNLSGLLYKITQVKHPSPRKYNPKIPKVCEQIIDKAMAKNPENRFTGANDMAKVIKLLGSKIDQLMKQKTE
ncbi:MAG: CHASE2 domain-containing protein [Deltaproteobacteria bacterium]|nr:CHASE2 domain-containing protein [Deltaproteobacteria bacterium]